MRVAILGTGAIGAVVATFARLSPAGHEIHLVGRRDRLAPVAASGLVYKPHDSEHDETRWVRTTGFHVHASITDVPAPVDAIFCTMKAPALDAGLDEARALLRACHPAVVLVMNGLGLRAIAARHVPPGDIIETIAFYPSRLDGNVVTNTGGNAWFTAEDTPLARRLLASVFDGSGVDLRFDQSFATTQWKKAVVNVGMNAVSALSMLPVGKVLETPPLRALTEAAVEEAGAVAMAAGVALGGDLVRDFLAFSGKDPAHRPSMQEDLDKGRPTEVDFLNGHVAAEGDRLGVPVPVNRALATLVHAAGERLIRHETRT